jgi:hypothetical protein
MGASTSAIYLTGALASLSGMGLNWIGTAIKANNETNALGVGFEAAGATASIAGSALSLLAPILSTLGVSLGAIAWPIGIAVVAFGALAAVM